MKLYFSSGSWELPGQQSKGASRVDLPNTPSGMCAWLNVRRVRADEPDPADTPDRESWAEAQGELKPAPAVPVRPSQPCTEATDVEDFLLNRATVAEVEQIFAALGCRFAEARS